MFTIHAGKTALEAFHHMAVDHKSCLGIVDDEGRLIGNVSVSDLRAVGGNNLALLNTTVAEFVVIVAGKGPSQEEAVAGARVSVSDLCAWLMRQSARRVPLLVLALYPNQSSSSSYMVQGCTLPARIARVAQRCMGYLDATGAGCWLRQRCTE